MLIDSEGAFGPTSKERQRLTLSITILSVLSVALGALVIAGWLLHWLPIIQIYPGSTPMAFNTALVFILSGVGLLAKVQGRSHIPQILGLAILVFALLILGQDVDFDLTWASITCSLNPIEWPASSLAGCLQSSPPVLRWRAWRWS